jgi:hypothetical protein
MNDNAEHFNIVPALAGTTANCNVIKSCSVGLIAQRWGKRADASELKSGMRQSLSQMAIGFHCSDVASHPGM